MRIFFSVGEPSGDQHAALLIRTLRRQQPQLIAEGFGGPQMAAEGAELLYPLTDLAVMGIFQVLPLINKFRGLVRQAREHLARQRPDVVVLVDFPGFNWWIASAAHELGIPVIYYMPPQLWAWASWRIRKVRKYVDLVLSGLEFETDWYRSRGIAAHYVGHPFFDEVAEHPLDQDFMAGLRSPFGRSPDNRSQLVALLPGSRRQEVERCWPLQLELVKRLQPLWPGVRFAVANYRETQLDFCQALMQDQLPDSPIEFHTGRTSEIIAAADLAVMVSGSVSLEILARKTPAAVIYACGPATYCIGRCLVNIKHMSLPNLIEGRELLPEHLFVGRDRRPLQRLEQTVQNWLTNPAELARSRADLERLSQRVGQPGGTQRTAAAILELAAARPGIRSAAAQSLGRRAA